MRRLLETRNLQGAKGQYVAQLFLETAEPTPNYVLDLLDPGGVLAQRTYLNTFVAYCLKTEHALSATDTLFSVAKGHVDDLDKAEKFELYLQELEKRGEWFSQ